MADYSPLFRTTVGPFDISEGFQTVAVEVLGRPLTYVSITPSQDADDGTPHELGVNVNTPVFDMTEGIAYEITLDRPQFQDDDPLLAHKLFVKAGRDATSFTITGHL
tara:strand:- start:1466 stop:1786 length:321 start_codon:yes stop_codon:yes gene_type:complete